MRRFFFLAVAAALAVGMSATSWSQTGGGGAGGGGAGGAGAGASGTAGAGTSNTAGAGASGTSAGVGTAGTAGAGASGTPTGAGTPSTAARTGATGTAGATGVTDVRTGPGARFHNSATANTSTSAALNNSMVGPAPFVNQNAFFTDPGVRQQLNLNANQFNTLNRAHQNAFLRYQRAVNSLNPNLTEQQRIATLQQLQAQFNADLSGTVNSTLTNPQTLNRFNQLNRQFMGFNAFNDPTIRQQLGLTQDQLTRIRALSNDVRRQLQQFRRGAGNDLSSVNMDQWNQIWATYGTQLNTILTPQQQQLWAQQIGRPFVFSPNTVFGIGTTDVSGTAGTTGTVGTTGSTVDDRAVNVDPTPPVRSFHSNTAPRQGTVQSGQPANQGTTQPAQQPTQQSTPTQGTAQGTSGGTTTR
jgi:hypothetical protein